MAKKRMKDVKKDLNHGMHYLGILVIVAIVAIVYLVTSGGTTVSNGDLAGEAYRGKAKTISKDIGASGQVASAALNQPSFKGECKTFRYYQADLGDFNFDDYDNAQDFCYKKGYEYTTSFISHYLQTDLYYDINCEDIKKIDGQYGLKPGKFLVDSASYFITVDDSYLWTTVRDKYIEGQTCESYPKIKLMNDIPLTTVSGPNHIVINCCRAK